MIFYEKTSNMSRPVNSITLASMLRDGVFKALGGLAGAHINELAEARLGDSLHVSFSFLLSLIYPVSLLSSPQFFYWSS